MRRHKPWLKFYDGIPELIDYPEVTMYEAVMETAKLKKTGQYTGE